MPREPLFDFADPSAEDRSDDTVRIPVGTLPYRTRLVPTLRVAAGRDLLSFVTIGPEEQILIGRDEGAELRLIDPTVSKRHCRVIADTNGAITVVDLDSTNGTSINGIPVRRNTPLRKSDHLEVGGVSLRLDLLSPDELAHLESVNKRLRAADRDPLTGLLTRRFLEERLPQLADSCARAETPFTCAFVDVDHFKKVNDTFGHKVGDEVLQTIARLLMLGLRDNDPCVRYGGEEIVLFLPGSNEVSGAEASDRVRKMITDHDWDRTTSGLRVTASFGVAERIPGEPLKDWLHRADEAAYAAKRAGRNRVMRAQGR